MNIIPIITSRQKLVIALAILTFVVLAIGSVLTHRPQIDEGMFADPARNLVEHGSTPYRFGFVGTGVARRSVFDRISDIT